MKIALGVLNGLQYAHQKEVIHGDLKPDNILLDSKNTALISDFGISRVIRTSDASQSWSMSLMKNQSSGYSPFNSAPELLDYDLGNIDRTTDIYAFGCTLFEMLTGRPPFIGDGVASLHLTKKPFSTQKYRSEIPDAIDAIVLKCLEKKQKDRFQSAEEIITELKKI